MEWWGLDLIRGETFSWNGVLSASIWEKKTEVMCVFKKYMGMQLPRGLRVSANLEDRLYQQRH